MSALIVIKRTIERNYQLMAKKQTPLRIIPLGGLDGIGKNMKLRAGQILKYN